MPYSRPQCRRKAAGNPFAERLFADRRPCVFAADPVSLLTSNVPTDSPSVAMRLSRFFLPILKENPKEAEIVSHRLMLRAGMMRHETAGHLPLPPPGLLGPQEHAPI